jgi:heme exporter protein C
LNTQSLGTTVELLAPPILPEDRPMSPMTLRRLGSLLILAGTLSAFVMGFGGGSRLFAFVDTASLETGLVIRFAIILIGLALYVAGGETDERKKLDLKAPPTSLSDWVFYALWAAASASTLYTIYFVFYVVPTEATMGIVQKIFYFHAPIAYSFYLAATACFVGSIGYLARGTSTWDALARAGADIAVVMGVLVMITGPLWGAKAWGVYWTWDPRLTTMMLSLLIYVAYAVLRAFSGGGDSEKKFSAALGILGGATLPIIHLAVRKWGGTHPEVIAGKGKGLGHPDMVIGILLGFSALTLLTIVLTWARARQHLAESRLEEAEEDAIERGLIGD